MPVIEEPTNARSRRTRAALLDATRATLERDGFDALTMAEVAEQAGVSRRAVYLHFTSRAELISHLFDHIAETEGLAESIASIWQAEDSRDALDRWARHIASYHTRLIAVDRAVQRMEDTDPDVARHRSRVDEAQRSTCDRLAAWLAKDDQLDPFWTVATASDLLFGLIATDLVERLVAGCQWETAQLADALGHLLTSTLVQTH